MVERLAQPRRLWHPHMRVATCVRGTATSGCSTLPSNPSDDNADRNLQGEKGGHGLGPFSPKTVLAHQLRPPHLIVSMIA
ncbi:hypothetical protein P7K49_033342 [Saguinus oedipus]|uniref:Uncharacterized protein n=1 Tax=Saguinus oedipus TaxID=9490 RepID=A0ABQ9TSF1_SAGOE|nr:hypothetical protein P7K49_033342 [Saguinus oedipus]